MRRIFVAHREATVQAVILDQNCEVKEVRAYPIQTSRQGTRRSVPMLLAPDSEGFGRAIKLTTLVCRNGWRAQMPAKDAWLRRPTLDLGDTLRGAAARSGYGSYISKCTLCGSGPLERPGQVEIAIRQLSSARNSM